MPSREQRVRVWRGDLKKTTGGLTKDDLVKNRKGKIVSRRESRQAADQNNLGEWLRNKGDRFQDMPQAHAAKGLKAPKPRPPKPVPEPKRERPPAPKRKPKYEDDDEWVPPGQAPKPKPVKPEPKPRALLPRPPRPLPKPKPRPKLKPKQVASLVHIAKEQKRLAPKPKLQKLQKAKPFRHKVDRDAGLAAGLRRRKPIKLHAGEPQPEYVDFKRDLGRSKLQKAPDPVLYVRKDPIVESAPIGSKRFGPRHAELSVQNIRRSSRRKKKRVDYSKYFDD